MLEAVGGEQLGIFFVPQVADVDDEGGMFGFGKKRGARASNPLVRALCLNRDCGVEGGGDGDVSGIVDVARLVFDMFKALLLVEASDSGGGEDPGAHALAGFGIVAKAERDHDGVGLVVDEGEAVLDVRVLIGIAGEEDTEAPCFEGFLGGLGQGVDLCVVSLGIENDGFKMLPEVELELAGAQDGIEGFGEGDAGEQMLLLMKSERLFEMNGDGVEIGGGSLERERAAYNLVF